MTTRSLLKQMELIASKLLTPNEFYICFERVNKRLIRAWGNSGRISVPFYWIISPTNSHIHAKHSEKEMNSVFLHIRFAQKNKTGEEYMIFEFDGDELFPVFPDKLLELAKQREEHKPYL